MSTSRVQLSFLNEPSASSSSFSAHFSPASMDAYEATMIVFSRIQTLDSDNAAKIMGLLLFQDHGEKEMIRLAFGPEALVHSVILKARKEHGIVTTSTPSTPSTPLISSLSPFSSRQIPKLIILRILNRFFFVDFPNEVSTAKLAQEPLLPVPAAANNCRALGDIRNVVADSRPGPSATAAGVTK